MAAVAMEQKLEKKKQGAAIDSFLTTSINQKTDEIVSRC